MFGIIVLVVLALIAYLFINSKVKSYKKAADRKERLKSSGADADFHFEGRLFVDLLSEAKWGDSGGLKAAIGIFKLSSSVRLLVENKEGNAEYNIPLSDISNVRVENYPSGTLGTYSVFLVGMDVDNESFPRQQLLFKPTDTYVPKLAHAMNEAMGLPPRSFED